VTAPVRIESTAPGKVVLWGEYAVLHGAPALVMAVNRYARCRLSATADSAWRCRSEGFTAAGETITRSRLLESSPPPPAACWALLWHVVRHLQAFPDGGEATFDTAGFHAEGRKLGLGSSAALCVAVYGAACGLLGRRPEPSAAFDIHHRLQGGKGSGIDVAAAWHGGLLRFRRGAEPVPAAEPWSLPAGLELRFVWTGTSASTGAHLGRLGTWLDAADGIELRDLAQASAALFDAAALPDALAHYVDALRALDRAAALGIFSPAHDHLHRLAIDTGVVYKPCGAGGGDIGAAFTDDADAADRFVARARQAGYLPLALETASHGLEVTG